jgi:hypothetical protein
VSSRLVRLPSGRPAYVEITTPLPDLEVGYRFAVLGTEISMTSSRIQFTGERSGRPPLPEETARARNGGARTRGNTPKAWTEADRVRALELVDAGWSQARAGRELGVPRPTVGAWVSARRSALATRPR